MSLGVRLPKSIELARCDNFVFVWQKDKTHAVSIEFRLKSLFLKWFEIDKLTIKTGKHTSTGTSSRCKWPSWSRPSSVTFRAYFFTFSLLLKYKTNFPLITIYWQCFTAMISAKLRRHVSSAVSHNMRIAGSSGNWNKKCCTVVTWWEQHSDPSRSFEHRAKNQMAAFKSGTRLDLKHLAVAQNYVNSQHSIRSTWFFSGRCILNNQRVCIFLKSYSLAEKSPLRRGPKAFSS